MSLLKTLQMEVAAQLQTIPEWAFMPVLTENLKDLQSRIDIALGPENATSGKQGIVAIVLTPEANANWEDVEGPFFDNVSVLVSILENVDTNRTGGSLAIGVAAPDAAEAACSALHQFYPLSANGPLRAKTPTIRIVPNEDYLQYNCRFVTMGGLKVEPPSVAQPVVTGSGGSYTVTCATPGAAIFYTLDGSNPNPRNANAFLYLNPITPPTGQTLNARAYLAGYLLSDSAITVNT